MSFSAIRINNIVAEARAHLNNNRLQDADKIIKQSLMEFPKNADLLFAAGEISINLEQFDRALVHLESAMRAAPNRADIRLKLGVGYQAFGRIDDAIQCYRYACQLDATLAQAYVNLGYALRAQDKLFEAGDAFRVAVELDPDHIAAVQGLAGILGRAITPEYSTTISDLLVQLFNSPYANYGDMAPSAACQLIHLFGIQDNGDTAQKFDAANPLLSNYLRKCVNVDPILEFALTKARRALLFSDNPDLDMAVLLGIQCFINEYIFYQQSDERQQTLALKQGLETALKTKDVSAPFECNLALVAMYEPLSALADKDVLVEDNGPKISVIFSELIQLTVANPVEEQVLKNDIESFCAVENETSQKVRSQYEVNPFPRWVHAPVQSPAHPGTSLKRMFPYFSPPIFLAEDSRILIAGSGTGQHVAHVALKYPEAKILTIDLSKSSLAYAIRMTRKLGITNVEFRHGDILQAGALDGPFDIIESIGVLHHMANPLDGWQVLVGLLRDRGMFRCGLYCERGRQGVFTARDIIAREGIGSSAGDIAAFRHRIFFNPPPGDFSRIKDRADFYTTSNCRDLLFHVSEDNYTPLRIKTEIRQLGLNFVGFEEFEDLGINNQYRKKFPKDPKLTNLLNWEKLEKSGMEPMEGYVSFGARNGGANVPSDNFIPSGCRITS